MRPLLQAPAGEEGASELVHEEWNSLCPIVQRTHQRRRRGTRQQLREHLRSLCAVERTKNELFEAAAAAQLVSKPAQQVIARQPVRAAGQSFDLQLVAELTSEAGLAELIHHGLIREDDAGHAAFRHALSWEAFYSDVPWLRRRALHHRVAEALEARGGQNMEIATHWLGAREPGRAREVLVHAARESEAVHAYRDAAGAGRQALELWPGDEDVDARNELLERYARCAELAGQLTEAIKGWRELAAIRSACGESLAAAEAHRRLAAVYELNGEREPAFSARRLAVQELAANGRPADAAIERLAMANHRRIGAKYSDAIGLARTAADEASAAERPDLRARALGLEGVARAKRGDFEAGLETVRTGLAMALEHDFTAVAAELYQRLGMVLYDSADYRRAEEALDAASGSAGSTATPPPSSPV